MVNKLLFPSVSDSELNFLAAPCSPRSPRLDGSLTENAADQIISWRTALDMLNVWHNRGERGTIPSMVEATWEILQTVLLDWQCETNNTFGSQSNLQVLRLGYAMAVTRCVKAGSAVRRTGSRAIAHGLRCARGRVGSAHGPGA